MLLEYSIIGVRLLIALLSRRCNDLSSRLFEVIITRPRSIYDELNQLDTHEDRCDSFRAGFSILVRVLKDTNVADRAVADGVRVDRVHVTIDYFHRRSERLIGLLS